MVQLAQLQGLWRRSLLVWPDGRRDTSSEVAWLQGPSLYVDLRQPDGPSQFDGVRCLRDLDRLQIRTLAAQEAFAGTLVRHADYFEWIRLIDFQPRLPHDDRGRLSERDEILIEQGYDVPYVEHWRRITVTERAAAITLSDRIGQCSGILVRAGDCFMYARNRSFTPEAGRPLVEIVSKAAALGTAQDLVDCDICLGTVSDGWRIERSTLPWRIGASLDLRRVSAGVATDDVAPDGTPFQRVWTICVEQGAFFDAVTAPSPAKCGAFHG